MKGVSESLAGRVAILQMLGFSYREILGQGESSPSFLPKLKNITASEKLGNHLTVKSLFNIIWRGSYPAMVIHKKHERDIFSIHIAKPIYNAMYAIWPKWATKCLSCALCAPVQHEQVNYLISQN